MRLQKYLASCGIASRRKSEELIKTGIVKVNDEVITEMGYVIEPDKDAVKINDKVITPQKTNIYVLLNKPIGYITTTSDQFNRKKVTDLVDISTRIFPVGRLDYNTSGLLLLTNDGELTLKLTHPKYKVEKTYLVKVQGKPTSRKLEMLRNGIPIEDYVTLPAKVEHVKEEKNNCILKIIIREGKNRQVRKMCEAIGHPVMALKRVAIGNIRLEKLPTGKWRYLTEKEIEYLKS
ncbi:ribosomal large subunit pseudouridine synthase B [Natronincola peptidivorans]|uniref:Pseudouridine synthase n=1 Tax=Natronincola peptidivorans TaxID=426128 RepID=A0A1H9YKH3_9FIRM|nr:pseudouridine synthase [Natronincola peptidivorans]SES69102.1 ribosomal large subunit pseudouridine synthase B [Natronincola peptidivorans]